jgi:predicted extracellular nuclease
MGRLVLLGGLASIAPACAGVPDCAEVTPISTIQGARHISPLVGDSVETCGVVTAHGPNGYFLQAAAGDARAATSDAVFVLEREERPDVGTRVQLRATVDEYIPGGADTGNLSVTQLVDPAVLGAAPDQALPDPVIIGRGGRMPPNRRVIGREEVDPPINLQHAEDAAATPFDPARDGIDFYESLEGMRVTVPAPVAVSAIRQFGARAAELFVLADRGADAAPPEARTARGGIRLQPHPDNRGDQNPERIQVQLDGRLVDDDFPPVTVGDRLGDVTGVVGYAFGNFEVRATTAFTREPAGPARATAFDAEPDGPDAACGPPLDIASYNVLNLSAVDGDDAQRRLVARHVAEHLGAPAIVALQEIQDDDGDAGDGDQPCPEPTDCPAGELSAKGTLARLVEAIRAAGGPDYRFIDAPPSVEVTDATRDHPDAFGGAPLGNIRNAFLYDPARVELVDATPLDRAERRRRGVSDPRAFDGSRDPLQATFRFAGRDVTLINVHFTSRFGSTPVFGGPQPFVQAGERARERQARAVHELVAARLAGDDTARVVVLGDFNTFEFTDDLARILPGDAPILHNLVHRNADDNVYSFNFEGNAQVLDHVFVTEALRPGARLDFVHVNTDFPRRAEDVVASDHEPVLARLHPAPEDAAACAAGDGT